MKQFSATYIQALKDAIVASVWYKDELKRFLIASLTDASILEDYDWKVQKKREIVDNLVDWLAEDQTASFEDFRRLTRGVVEMARYPGLESLDDSDFRISEAKRLKEDLKRLVASHNENASAEKKEREYTFFKEEYERRKNEDAVREERRAEEDALRKSNPHQYFGRILKLQGKVSKDQIKQQYRDLVKAYHPDRFQSLDGEFIELATRRAQHTEFKK